MLDAALGSRITFSSVSGEKQVANSRTFSYEQMSVDSGNTWRPMDRATEISVSGVLDGAGDYTIKNGLWVMLDGSIINDEYDTLSPDSHFNNPTDPYADYVNQPATPGESDVNNSDIPTVDPTPVASPTYITVKDLTVESGGTIDLAYLNTMVDIPKRLAGDPSAFSGTLSRTIIAENASLADGTILHFGSYSVTPSTENNQTTAIDNIGTNNDQLFVKNATTPDDHATIYYELGYVPNLGTASQGAAQKFSNDSMLPVFFGILNGDTDKFDVEGRSTVADGIFSKYTITPVVGRYDDYFNNPDPDGPDKLGTAWYLDSYSWVDLNTTSESGMAAANSSVALNNLWRGNYLNMFRRTGSLHRQGFTKQQTVIGEAQHDRDSSVAGAASYPEKIEDQKENAWVETWHGKYSSVSGYGRQVDQSYNGIQAGYDKLLNKEIKNGKVYTGFFVSKIDGKSNTLNGGGDQGSEGLGIYTSWVGNNGRYFDAAVAASRLSGNYNLIGDTGSELGRITGDYATWAYGLGLQYGYKSPETAGGWFYEPSVALFLGRIDGGSYNLSNNLGIDHDSGNTATGRLGIKAGKQLTNGKGNVYAGVAVLHEFAGGVPVTAFWGNQRMPLETAGGKDTWLEWSLGGNWQLSPAATFNLNFDKTTGSSVGNDWRINGGLSWTWGGFWGDGKSKAKDLDTAVEPGERAHGNAALIIGHAPEQAAAPTAEQQTATGLSVQPDAQVSANPASDSADAPVGGQQSPDGVRIQPDTVVSTETERQPIAGSGRNTPIVTSDASHTGDYVLPSLTVEAARPSWEKNLSPGQVSVVYPEQFEGEQKDLPDLLERVPGLFVQRVSGDGHYTVARVRGSTGAQVNVYVDGVLMNLNGEAAVNLSSIPVDNVERIEVYRGYVPARFSGSPLGGVINIVTKKPKETGGVISQGIKSYGGYTGNYQLTAPAGSGSLLFTYQRDIWGGDFPFTTSDYGRWEPGSPPTYEITPGTDFNRRANGYRNSNGMVKWQNDNWTVKAAWKDLHEQLPRAVDNLRPVDSNGNLAGTGGGYNENYHKGYYDDELNTSQQELQVGRRATTGNLDWGWKVYYLKQKKDHRNVGIYKYAADTGTDPDQYKYIPGFTWSRFESDKWGINLNSSMKMGGSHLVEFNFDYSDENMDADGSNWTDWDDTWASRSFNRQYIRNYKIREYHLTLQDSITLNQAGDFKLTPILRADKVVMSTMADNDMKWKYSGAVALQKEFGSHWSVKTNWGTYNRHPNFYELFGDGATIAPNALAAKYFDLDGQGTWESGVQFDFGVGWQGKMGQADAATALTWFQRKSKNQFALWQPNVPNAPASYYPMDEANVHGLELTHDMKWRRTGFSLSGTWQKSEYSDPSMNGVANGMKSVISYTPEWVWNARVDYLFPGDKLNIFAEYHYTDKQLSGRNPDENYDSYLDALTTVNLGAKYSFNKNWKLSVGVNDVFNKGYEARQIHYIIGAFTDTYARPYPLPGRMYYATMEYKF